jgi:hypothetical protein
MTYLLWFIFISTSGGMFYLMVNVLLTVEHNKKMKELDMTYAEFKWMKLSFLFMMWMMSAAILFAE